MLHIGTSPYLISIIMGIHMKKNDFITTIYLPDTTMGEQESVWLMADNEQEYFALVECVEMSPHPMDFTFH